MSHYTRLRDLATNTDQNINLDSGDRLTRRSDQTVPVYDKQITSGGLNPDFVSRIVTSATGTYTIPNLPWDYNGGTTYVAHANDAAQSSVNWFVRTTTNRYDLPSEFNNVADIVVSDSSGFQQIGAALGSTSKSVSPSFTQTFYDVLANGSTLPKWTNTSWGGTMFNFTGNDPVYRGRLSTSESLVSTSHQLYIGHDYNANQLVFTQYRRGYWFGNTTTHSAMMSNLDSVYPQPYNDWVQAADPSYNTGWKMGEAWHGKTFTIKGLSIP